MKFVYLIVLAALYFLMSQVRGNSKEIFILYLAFWPAALNLNIYTWCVLCTQWYSKLFSPINLFKPLYHHHVTDNGTWINSLPKFTQLINGKPIFKLKQSGSRNHAINTRLCCLSETHFNNQDKYL